MEIAHQLDRYITRHQHEQKLLTPLTTQLALDQNPISRNTLPGHITASAIVIRGKEMLMIFHPFLKAWLQPGGHIESGELPVTAAQRELLEETGLHGEVHGWHKQNLMPIDIDIHLIPANPGKGEPEHLHYDFRYLFVSDYILRGQGESDHTVAWKNIQDIDGVSLKELIGKLKSENILT
jgi:8-oxo-dGTP pyrophosphatase MutT (NUDIX family)